MTNVRELLDTAAGEPAAATPDVVTAEERDHRESDDRRGAGQSDARGCAQAAPPAQGEPAAAQVGGDHVEARGGGFAGCCVE